MCCMPARHDVLLLHCCNLIRYTVRRVFFQCFDGLSLCWSVDALSPVRSLYDFAWMQLRVKTAVGSLQYWLGTPAVFIDRWKSKHFFFDFEIQTFTGVALAVRQNRVRFWSASWHIMCMYRTALARPLVWLNHVSFCAIGSLCAAHYSFWLCTVFLFLLCASGVSHWNSFLGLISFWIE